jgi:hypothetical protein
MVESTRPLGGVILGHPADGYRDTLFLLLLPPRSLLSPLSKPPTRLSARIGCRPCRPRQVACADGIVRKGGRVDGCTSPSRFRQSCGRNLASSLNITFIPSGAEALVGKFRDFSGTRDDRELFGYILYRTTPNHRAKQTNPLQTVYITSSSSEKTSGAFVPFKAFSTLDCKETNVSFTLSSCDSLIRKSPSVNQSVFERRRRTRIAFFRNFSVLVSPKASAKQGHSHSCIRSITDILSQIHMCLQRKYPVL